MPRFLLPVIGLIVILASAVAQAWNPAGHMAIASVAYEQLTQSQRAKFVELLKTHPRFEPDFAQAMPQGLTDEQQSRWIFMRAATWPDIARSLVGDDQKYHHPTWHYIDWPVYLDDAARQKIHPPQIDTDYRNATGSAAMNAVQALNKSLAELKDASTPPSQKAVALCWVLHLCGDIHQPLHGAALFSAARFRQIPIGDRGGNDIPILVGADAPNNAKPFNLHALWDGLLTRDDSFEAVVATAKDLQERHPASDLAEKAKDLSAETWSKESLELTRQVVYTPAVLEVVKAGEQHPLAPLPPINLNEQYLMQAHAVATERAALSAYRTANLLQGIQ